MSDENPVVETTTIQRWADGEPVQVLTLGALKALDLPDDTWIVMASPEDYAIIGDYAHVEGVRTPLDGEGWSAITLFPGTTPDWRDL